MDSNGNLANKRKASEMDEVIENEDGIVYVEFGIRGQVCIYASLFFIASNLSTNVLLFIKM